MPFRCHYSLCIPYFFDLLLIVIIPRFCHLFCVSFFRWVHTGMGIFLICLCLFLFICSFFPYTSLFRPNLTTDFITFVFCFILILFLSSFPVRPSFAQPFFSSSPFLSFIPLSCIPLSLSPVLYSFPCPFRPIIRFLLHSVRLFGSFSTPSVYSFPCPFRPFIRFLLHSVHLFIYPAFLFRSHRLPHRHVMGKPADL